MTDLSPKNDPALSIYGDAGRAFLNPSALFVDSNYRLRINAWCSAAGVTLALRYRFLRANDNEIVDAAEQLVPTSNRVLSTTTAPLPIGMLLNAQVFALAGAPPYGTCFAQVVLERGAGAAATVVGVLLQAYITANQAKAWPGSVLESSFDGAGALRSIAGTQPAAGAEISETVPNGARWQLIAFTAKFVTSAAVANRFPTLTLDDGGAIIYARLGALASAQAASITQQWSFLTGLNAQVNQSFMNGAMSDACYLGAGFRIKSLTVAIDVADQWSQVQYLVREWLTTD